MISAREAAFRLLKNRGRIFLCCPAGAVSRFCALLEANRLVPKRFRRVRAAEGKPPYLLLIEAVKLGGDGAVWEEDLVLPAAEKAPEALETRAADGIIHKTDPRSGGEDGGKA